MATWRDAAVAAGVLGLVVTTGYLVWKYHRKEPVPALGAGFAAAPFVLIFLALPTGRKE